MDFCLRCLDFIRCFTATNGLDVYNLNFILFKSKKIRSALYRRKRIRINPVSPSLLHKVFVYGTLKRGEPNHNWLTKPENGLSTFIKEGHTVKQYPLVIASRYNIPFLLDYPGKGHNVTGEVFEVDNQMLSNLDILEEHPTYYTRRLEKIQLNSSAENEEPIQCWTYFLNAAKPHLLELPMLADYRSKGEHGLPYHERYQRDPNYNYRPEVSQQ